MRTISPLEIRAVRRYALALTQRALAERLGVTRRCVEHWEGGTRNIPLATWRAMTRGVVSSTKPHPDAIRRARRVANLSQPRACALLGVPLRTFQQWENAERSMPGLQWALFLELAGLPVGFSTSTKLLSAPTGFYA